MSEPFYETTPPWEVLLERWRSRGKITEKERDTMENLIANGMWSRERKGYFFGRAYRGRQQHGG